MRPSNRPPKEREISVAITTGNKSPVGGVVIGGDLYQDCTIITLDIKASNDTKDIKGIKGVGSLGGLLNMVEDCATKISLLAEFLTQGKPGYNLEISEKGFSGACLVLRDVEKDLDLIVDEISKKTKKDPKLGARDLLLQPP